MGQGHHPDQVTLSVPHMGQERPGLHCRGQELHPVPIRHWEGWQQWYWEGTEGNGSAMQLDWEALLVPSQHLRDCCLALSLPKHLPHTAATIVFPPPLSAWLIWLPGTSLSSGLLQI